VRVSDSASPGVSVIIAANNAAATLGQTLDSLLSQTSFDWEAIVIDDGSTDATANIARAYASRTNQIRVVSQPKSGVGSARNSGIALARGAWLLFLDADDWIAPTAIEQYLGAATPEFDLIVADWVRVTADGSEIRDPFRLDPAQLFDTLARHCPFAIHACLVRASLVAQSGGFEPSFAVGSDWDFWQRVARAGARVRLMDETLAFYRVRPNSTAVNVDKLLEHGLQIIRVGHGSDPRVAHPSPALASGAPGERLASALLNFISWPAGMLIGQGKDATPLPAKVGDATDPTLSPSAVAYSIYLAALLPASLGEISWASLWSSVERRVDAYLAALEQQSQAPDLARQSKRELERLVIARSDQSHPVAIGGTLWFPLELTDPVPDIRADARIENLTVQYLLEGTVLGTVELPVSSRFVPRAVLLDAAVDSYGWAILERFLQRNVYSDLEFREWDGAVEVSRNGVQLFTGLPGDSRERGAVLHDAIGWTVFLQELWGEPTRPKEWFYDSSVDRDQPEPAEAIGKGILEVSQPLMAWRTDGASADVEVRVGGATVAVVNVPSQNGLITRAELRARCASEAGYNMYRGAVREGIIGQPLVNSWSLRERLAASAVKRSSGTFRAFTATHHTNELQEGDRTPAISLIVCTRNRAMYLRPCLDAISAMRPTVSWELIVVDNGSSDHTPQLLNDLKSRAWFPMVIVSERKAGLAAARNAGVMASRGSVLVFTDDDCYPAVDFLDQYAMVFADPKIGYATGRILLHDPDDFPITIRTDAEPYVIPPRGFIEPGQVQGANMAFRREVVLTLGGFDPALGPGGMFNFEDLDMSSRASLAGYAGGYFPGPTVRHHHRRRLPSDIAALRRSYAGGRGAYFASLIMRGAPRTPIARHLYHSLSWKPKGELVQEIVSAVHYTAYRLVHRSEHPLINTKR
jgi:glycosyltransferase involved in cell wall biosynthesis